MTDDAKGPTKSKFFVSEVGDAFGRYFLIMKSSSGNSLCGVNDKADANLIADAFNVYAETGLTPREMMAERDRYRTALEFYAEQTNWKVTLSYVGMGGSVFIDPAAQDHGDVAKEALSPEKKEPKP